MTWFADRLADRRAGRLSLLEFVRDVEAHQFKDPLRAQIKYGRAGDFEAQFEDDSYAEPDTWDEVISAYYQGLLTAEEYAALNQ